MIKCYFSTRHLPCTYMTKSTITWLESKSIRAMYCSDEERNILLFYNASLLPYCKNYLNCMESKYIIVMYWPEEERFQNGKFSGHIETITKKMA